MGEKYRAGIAYFMVLYHSSSVKNHKIPRTGTIMRHSKRHSEILRLLREEGTCTIARLAARLDVSLETIRRDVKPLAKQLLDRFGDFNGVISALPARLRDLPGVGQAVVCELKVVEAAAHRLARARGINHPALSSWSGLMEYCKTTMAHRETEQFRILFLDKKNVLIADERQQEGTIDHTPVYPREVIKRALELGASAIIMVHNHPSGDPTPSRDDIEMTLEVMEAGKKLGIKLHDHIVIAKSGHSSFKTLGLI